MARVSRYEDVKDGILAKISDAALAHSKPPAVRTLAQEFEVSVSTMHSYLTRLADEGMIHWRPGRHRSLTCTPQGFQRLSQSAP
jgi:DNA-binding GntR family transcriptional regulator